MNSQVIFIKLNTQASTKYARLKCRSNDNVLLRKPFVATEAKSEAETS